MADNNSVYYAIAGIVFMSMIVPLILSPLPVSFGASMTGYVPANQNNPPPSTTCVDHDGNDIYTASYVTYKGTNYVDTCSGSQLIEMICAPDKKGNLVKTPVAYTCTYGCANTGACKTAPISQESCKDSDYGIIDYIAGYVNGYKADGSYYDYSDYCLAPDKLVEYYCNNNQPFFTELPCTNFVNETGTLIYTCENNACVYKGMQ